MKHTLKTFEVPDLVDPEFSYEIAVLKKIEFDSKSGDEVQYRTSYVLNAGEATNNMVIYADEVDAYLEILTWIKANHEPA